MNDEGFVEQFTQKLMTGKKVFVTDNYRKRLQEELLHVTKRLIFVRSLNLATSINTLLKRLLYANFTFTVLFLNMVSWFSIKVSSVASLMDEEDDDDDT